MKRNGRSFPVAMFAMFVSLLSKLAFLSLNIVSIYLIQSCQ